MAILLDELDDTFLLLPAALLRAEDEEVEGDGREAVWKVADAAAAATARSLLPPARVAEAAARNALIVDGSSLRAAFILTLLISRKNC